MSVIVNYYVVLAILFGALGVLSVLSHLFVRRHVALAWLSAGLIVGTIATVTFKAGGAGKSAFALLAITEPIALFAVSQAIRLVVGAPPFGKAFNMAVSALVGLSLAMILAGGWSPVVQCLPFEIAGLLIVLGALRVVVTRGGGWPEKAIIIGLSMHAVTHLIRMPYFPSLLDSGAAFPSAASPWLNLLLLTTSSFYVPMLVFGVIARDVAGHIDTLRQASMRDGLTGLLTRLAFEHEAARTKPRFGALVTADLDHFKLLNDTFGHPAGDEALRAFARLCADASPIAGRIGGEEFAFLLPGASISDAERVAEIIRTAFRQSAFDELEGARLSASFGIAAYGGRETFRETLIKADRALYRAKRQGRDCIVLHGTAAGEAANRLLSAG